MEFICRSIIGIPIEDEGVACQTQTRGRIERYSECSARDVSTSQNIRRSQPSVCSWKQLVKVRTRTKSFHRRSQPRLTTQQESRFQIDLTCGLRKTRTFPELVIRFDTIIKTIEG